MNDQKVKQQLDAAAVTGAPGPQITPAVIKNAQSIKCECGGIMFQEKITFKKVSSFLSPTGKEEIIPIPVMVCESCGKVPSVFDPQNLLPKSLKAVKSTEEPKGKVVDFKIKK